MHQSKLPVLFLLASFAIVILFCGKEVEGGRKKAHKDDAPYFFVFQRYEYPQQRSAQPFYFIKNIGYAHQAQPYAFQKQIIKYKNVGGYK